MKAPASAGIEVRPVALDRAGISAFCRVQAGCSGAEPGCVLPLEIEVAKVLSDANPFWRHARRALWIAWREGRPVGRIAAILDEVHESEHGERCAFFGFFESQRDPAVAGALLRAAEAWAEAAGAVRVRGPMNPNINEECGLLIEGHALPNAVMMPHNPPWYAELIEGAGYSKAKDLVGFDLSIADSPRERLLRLRDGLKRRSSGVELVAVTRGNLWKVLPDLKRIYNSAWERNWSAVPMTDPEIDFLASRLEGLLVGGLVWLARVGGNPAGLLLAVPDVNEVLGPMRGRLLSWATLPALPTLLGWRRTRRIRLIALGVDTPYRGRGLEGWMFAETLLAAEAMGFEGCEASWVLEDNVRVHQLAGLFRARITRRYRIYDRDMRGRVLPRVA